MVKALFGVSGHNISQRVFFIQDRSAHFYLTFPFIWSKESPPGYVKLDFEQKGLTSNGVNSLFFCLYV